MSTLRITNIEAKADASSPSVDEKVKIKNSGGDTLLQLDGSTSGVSTVTVGNKITLQGDTGSFIATTGTFSGDISGRNVTGVAATFTGALKVGGVLTYEDVTNVDSVGVVTARNGIRVGAGKSIGSDSGTVSYYGDGSNLSGISAGEFFGNVTGVSTDKNVGIQTHDVNRADLVGAGNSFVGMYLGDGFIGFPTHLGRPGGYYITTAVNALNAGPITLGSTMTLDGAWVIV